MESVDGRAFFYLSDGSKYFLDTPPADGDPLHDILAGLRAGDSVRFENDAAVGATVRGERWLVLDRQHAVPARSFEIVVEAGAELNVRVLIQGHHPPRYDFRNISIVGRGGRLVPSSYALGSDFKISGVLEIGHGDTRFQTNIDNHFYVMPGSEITLLPVPSAGMQSFHRARFVFPEGNARLHADWMLVDAIGPNTNMVRIDDDTGNRAFGYIQIYPGGSELAFNSTRRNVAGAPVAVTLYSADDIRISNMRAGMGGNGWPLLRVHIENGNFDDIITLRARLQVTCN